MKRQSLPRRQREHRAGQVGRAETHGVAEEGRDETGTRSAEPWTHITASVTLCQVLNKDCGLNGLRGCGTANSHNGNETSQIQLPHPSQTTDSTTHPPPHSA